MMGEGTIVPGFTGLTRGSPHYVQDDKTVGTSVGTLEIFVGKSINATQMLITRPPGMQFCGSDTDTDDTLTVPAVARFAIVEISMVVTGDGKTHRFSVTVARVGATPINVSDIYFPGIEITSSVDVTWSGNVITLNRTGTGGITSSSAIAYFYR